MTIIDLTYPLEDEMSVYPGDPLVSIRDHDVYELDGYRVTGLSLGTHSGTHIDAPSHTEADGKSLDEFPITTFIFEAERVDCRHRGARERIRLEDLPETVDGDLLVFQTGWDTHWGTDAYLDHPYLDVGVAKWCAERGIHVALDAFGPDPTPSDNARPREPTDSPAHHALLSNDCLIIENLRGVDRVPDRFVLEAFPLAIAGADGAPVRAIARFA
ncbi:MULTISPECIES: cyclase family protein [unclassified Haladaptatus]|uniref:cyclase family protein n=1 Tax=unclassified Haladaptatus TaxID=2622732 RepID=UPI0023E84E42|nr:MULTISPECIES: cyclase family protein [unclassified Haladaptatus]